MWRRYQIPLLLALVLLAVVGIVLLKPGMRPEELAGAQSAASLSCEVFCSETRVGVSVAELTFGSAAGDLSELALEVTVYKNGFAIGRFARVSPIRAGQKFEIIRPAGEQGSAPGFDMLMLTEVHVASAGGLVKVRVEGLDAGLNYFWRVIPIGGSGPGTETTMCQAPECPVDSEREEVPVPGPR
jgi:hypothetical protein